MPNSKISKKAKIGTNVIINDTAIIEDDVEIGNNVEIGPNVLVANGARISDNVKIHYGAIISTTPQDLKFGGEETTLEIGEGTIVREYATLNRATNHSKRTIIGKNCFLMAYVHVAHDCRLGDNVILANSVQMGGHVMIGNWAIVGGLVAIHQFTHVGQHSIIGGGFRAAKDVPPYIVAANEPLRYEGINLVGLRRRSFTNEQIQTIKNVYHKIYNSGLNVSDAVKSINDSFEITEEVQNILNFIKSSDRGILRGFSEKKL
jgi:UDP-N-acetylglucosamine acyltransferase